MNVPPRVFSGVYFTCAGAELGVSTRTIAPVELLATLFQELLSVHRDEFPPAQQPVAPPPPEPDVEGIRRRHREAAPTKHCPLPFIEFLHSAVKQDRSCMRP